MIIKYYVDKELTELDGFIVFKNTSRDEILDFIKKEDLDRPAIIKLIETAKKQGIEISLEN